MKFLRNDYFGICLTIVLTIIGGIISLSLMFAGDIFNDHMIDYLYNNRFLIISLLLIFILIIVIIMSFIKIRHLHITEEEKRLKSYSRRLERAMALEPIKEDQEEVQEEEKKVKRNITGKAKKQVKERVKEQKEEANENEKEENAKIHDTKKEIDALGRMLINLEDIKEFYTWSQKQAKASFVLAVSMCILGFILMFIAILLPIIFNLSFETHLIPAIGGIITELVAVTALSVYKSSLTQLNHYHKALHEDERFLSSVNLIGRFSTIEAQDDMLCEIIRSEIQMNLIDLEKDKDIKLETTNKKVVLNNNDVENK